MSAPAHRRSDARARRAHLRGLRADSRHATWREYDRLLDALTINVTKLFRNWEAYAAIAATVVPALWHRETPQIRVWSAGCSSGEEPYSLAILFHRYAAASGMLAQLGRVDVLGTDIDRRVPRGGGARRVRGGRLRRHAGRSAAAVLRARSAVHRVADDSADACASSRATC